MIQRGTVVSLLSLFILITGLNIYAAEPIWATNLAGISVESLQFVGTSIRVSHPKNPYAHFEATVSVSSNTPCQKIAYVQVYDRGSKLYRITFIDTTSSDYSFKIPVAGGDGKECKVVFDWDIFRYDWEETGESQARIQQDIYKGYSIRATTMKGHNLIDKVYVSEIEAGD